MYSRRVCGFVARAVWQSFQIEKSAACDAQSVVVARTVCIVQDAPIHIGAIRFANKHLISVPMWFQQQNSLSFNVTSSHDAVYRKRIW